MRFQKAVLLSGLFCIVLTANAYGQKIEQDVLTAMQNNLRVKSNQEFANQEIVSLDTALKRSAQRSGQLFILKDEYKLAKLRYKNSIKDLIPDVAIAYEETDGSTIGEDFRAEGTKLEMSYEVFPYNRSFKKYKQAKLMKEAAKLKYDYNMIKILSRAEKAYYIFAEAVDRHNKIKAMMNVFAEAKDKAKDMVSRNVARDVDLKEVQLLFTEARIKMNQAKNEYMLAELSLKQLWDYYSSSPLNIVHSDGYILPELDYASLSQLALENRPDIRLYKLTEKISVYTRDIASMEEGVKMMVDGFWGRKAENYDSEPLEADNEYYVGFKVSMPFGSSTIESEYIDQDTVPSAGQTTSTRFSSKNIKLKLFDNKHDEKSLKSNIAHYKSVEEGEELKKSIIFDLGRNITKVNEKYEMLSLAQQKTELALDKLELNKIGLSSNEITLIQYMQTAMDLLNRQEEYSKALAAYYVSITELNGVLGMPGYFNPMTGKSGEYYTGTYNLKSELVFDESSGKHRKFSDDNTINSYKDLRFKKQQGYSMGFSTTEYVDQKNNNAVVK